MIDPILERALSLFTTAEWRIVIYLLLCTITLTHTLKILLRLSPIKGGGNGAVQVIAIVSGFFSAFLLWPETSGPWYVAGIIAGPASSVAFKFAFAMLNKLSPTFASIVNFDRRREDQGIPPGVIPRRKEDEQNGEKPQ